MGSYSAAPLAERPSSAPPRHPSPCSRPRPLPSDVSAAEGAACRPDQRTMCITGYVHRAVSTSGCAADPWPPAVTIDSF